MSFSPDFLFAAATIGVVFFAIWFFWSLLWGNVPFSAKARQRKERKIVLGAAQTFILSYEDLPAYRDGGEFAARMKETDPETGEAKWVDRFVEGDMETSLSRKPEWYCQVQHYLAVTGWEMWHLAVLIGNRRFLWYDVPRDQAWIDEMVRQEAEFWKHVERRENIWEA
jgi:hypothetical protein